jgi:TolB-like protein
MAIGPFFAPVGNDALRQASQALPELLVAELSHMPRFQLVEREKVQSVWSEYNLTASGLVARDTVAKLGHVLECDWLVSGSLVQANGRTHIWTKVIDVRSGVVVDLNASAYDPDNSTKTIAAIAAFLQKAGTQPKGRQFIAMGRFVDMNPALATKREDWSRRIPALIEKHFLDAGFGVVEMAAVGPIFEERRLEAAGLTGNPDGRVKLQAAFWLIDGGCEWNETAPDKLNIGLRIQKVGASEQMFRLTESAGDGIEHAVIATIRRAITIQRAITNENFTATPSPNAEADLLLARAEEIAAARSPFEQKQSRTKTQGQAYTQWDVYKQHQDMAKRGRDNVNANLAIYERTLLRDPNNFEAKTKLGSLLLTAPEPANRERAKQLLREVAASQSPFAEHAKNYLKNADMMLRHSEKLASSKLSSFNRRPDDWQSLNQAFAENPNDMETKCDLGAALLRVPRASDRDRGRKMLTEVVAGDRPDHAERARKLLAEPEKTPAIPDELMTSAPPARLLPPALEPEENAEREQREFLQKNFSKFAPVEFAKEGPETAKFQRVLVKESTFDYMGYHFCGFRFTTPEWLDGDLRWMHILAKTEEQKDFSTRTRWNIIPKSGRMRGFSSYSWFSVADHLKLKERFPYTQKGFLQSLPVADLQPDQEYAIWFAHKEDNVPDIAYSLTISSRLGYGHFGMLPLQ